MRKIAVLTYPVRHRKTYDVLSLLKANGYSDVKVYAIPFHYQKKKRTLIQHRPEMNFHVPEISKLCFNFGYSYELGDLESFHIENDRIVLIAGAGILPQEFVDAHTTINSHPGYIPNCRGLDAFKWAIFARQISNHLPQQDVPGYLPIPLREQLQMQCCIPWWKVPVQMVWTYTHT